MSELEEKRKQRVESKDKLRKYTSYAVIPLVFGFVMDMTMGNKGRDSITVATGNPEFPPLSIIGFFLTVGLILYYGMKGYLKNN